MLEEKKKPHRTGVQATDKWEKCVKKLKKQGDDKYNPFAVCTASLEKAKKENLVIYNPSARKFSLTERGKKYIRENYDSIVDNPIFEAIKFMNEALEEAPPVLYITENASPDEEYNMLVEYLKEDFITDKEENEETKLF